MIITSLGFAVFTLVVLALYYLVPHKQQNYVLLLASYAFLISWNVQFALVYLGLTAINYIIALYIADMPKKRHTALYLGITFNIIVLGFFKYSDFFVPNAIEALQRLGLQTNSGVVSILLPIGLSFFTVQTISYLLDVSRGVTKPARNPVTFALYIVYFPRLVSGPIVRAQEFIPILESKRTINTNALGDGAVLLLQGLIRKIVIADLLSFIVPLELFTQPQRFSAPDLALWLVAYAFALYNDFAGYTLIVRAISTFFGIPLPENFRLPYFSRSFTEFWRGWHITLSNWLRDYVFMPSMRFLLRRKYSPTSIACVVIPPMTTMIVSALWHSVSPSMLLWGALHGIYLIGERVQTLNRPPTPINTQSYWRQLLAIVIVFVLTVLAWVPFKTDLPSTLQYWGSLLSPVNWFNALIHPSTVEHTIGIKYTIDLVALIGLSLVLDMAYGRFGEQAFKKLPIPVQAIVLNVALLMLLIAAVAQNAPPPFVYQGF